MVSLPVTNWRLSGADNISSIAHVVGVVIVLLLLLLLLI